MSLHKIKGDYQFECNDCLATLETETGNFDAAQNRLKRERWKAIKKGPDWQHQCLNCQSSVDAKAIRSH